ncbi:MAG TPA: response regulator [Hydrogenophaga sp.]|nr:response regulator [Hydrogenophaga sp.]
MNADEPDDTQAPLDKLQALKHSCSQVAHKINNLLSPAALYVDAVLAREHQLSARSQEQLRSVHAAIDEVSQALESLRQFDRPTTSDGTHVDAQARASAPPAPPREPTTAQPTAAVGLRVLLVDDDPLLLEALTHTVNFDGHAVVCAPDAPEGLVQAERANDSGQPFDVVITDLTMHGMDGLALAEQLKTRTLAGHVILLTGWSGGALDETQPPEHIDQVMTKPPRLLALRSALARVPRVR